MDSPRSSVITADWSDVGHIPSGSVASASVAAAAAPAVVSSSSSSIPPSTKAHGNTTTTTTAAAGPTSGPTVPTQATSSSTGQSMSLIRALDEVTMLDKRITKKVSECTFVASLSKKNRATLNPDEFSRTAKSDWQAVNDLITRRHRIKSAILKANAETKVRVSGEILSVAEVIERRKCLTLSRELLMKMKTSRESTLRAIDQHNAAMDADLQKLLEIHFGKSGGGNSGGGDRSGGGGGGGNRSTNPGDIEDISKPYRDNNQARLLDPIALDSKIRDLEAYVDAFEREAKFTLSEANAITYITI